MGLQEQGVRLVVEGQNQFMSAMRNADGSVHGFNQTTASSEKPTKGLTAWTLGLANAMGQALYNGAIAATRAISGFATSSVGAASDLDETITKVGVVFEDMGPAMVEFGKTSAAALGMSQNEALTAAATYGNLFRAFGTSTEASFDMSKNLVELAADLASFNNIDPEIVLDKLRAGLTGEAEPLKTLGISINETILKERALELALWDGVGVLDANAKAQAAYSLMMEQTSLAQGDFDRTSGGLANQQRILAANVANVKATLGAGLLPIVTAVTKAFNTLIASPAFQGAIQNLSKWLEGLSGKLSNLFSGLGEGGGFGDILGNLVGGMLGGMGQNQAKILEFGLSFLTSVADGIMAAIPNIVPVVMSLISSIIEFLATALPNLLITGIDILLALIDGIVTAIPQLIDTVVTLIPTMVTTLLKALPRIIEAALNIIIALAKGLIEAIPVLLPEVPKIIEAIFTAIIESLPLIIEAAVELILALITGIIDMLPTLADQAGKIVVTIVESVIKLIPKLADAGAKLLIGLWDGIEGKWDWFIDKVIGVAESIVKTVKKILGITSPSEIFEDFGLMIDVGWAKGILKGAKYLLGATSTATQAVLSPVAGAITSTYSYATTNQYNLNVMTSQSPRVVQNSFAMMQLMAGT